MSDRDSILDNELKALPYKLSDAAKQCIHLSMDEYMKATCLELLEYMANNEVSCEINIAKEKRYYFKGQWISKEELFENFL